MSQNGPTARLQGSRAQAEPSLAELLDPVALEARLSVARARRADAIARRSASNAGRRQPLPTHGTPADAPTQGDIAEEPVAAPPPRAPVQAAPPSGAPRPLSTDVPPLLALPPLGAGTELARASVETKAVKLKPRRFAARFPVALALGMATGVAGATAALVLAPELPWNRSADSTAPQGASASVTAPAAPPAATPTASPVPQPPAPAPTVVAEAPSEGRSTIPWTSEPQDAAAVRVAALVSDVPGRLPTSSPALTAAPSVVSTAPADASMPAAQGTGPDPTQETSAVRAVASLPAGGQLTGPAVLPTAPSVRAEAPAAGLAQAASLQTPGGETDRMETVPALASPLGPTLAAASRADRPPRVAIEPGRFGLRAPVHFAEPAPAGRARVALVLPGGLPAPEAVGYALPPPTERTTPTQARAAPSTPSRRVSRATPSPDATAQRVERIVLQRAVEDMLRDRLNRR